MHSLPVAGGASLLGIAAGGAWLGSVWLFRTTGLVLPPVMPVLGGVATFILLTPVADAYDAMVSRRIYKEPIPHDEAARIIVKGKGTLFDPDVVDAFLRVESQWRQVSIELADSD